MPVKYWFYLFLLCLLFRGTPPAGAQSGAGEIEDSPSAPDARFGVVEAFWSPEQAAALNPGWERILFYWSEIQPEGPQDWNTLHVLEEWLAAADQDGRQVVGLLKHTPEWATDGPAFGGVPRGLYLPPDDPQNLWANYVRRIAAYYGPRGVHHWIIWNEPDIDAGTYGNEFVGTVADYYQMVKVAYLVMKAEDPQAFIHLAGLTFWHDEVAGRDQYLARFLRTASDDPDAAAYDYFFDALSLHIYFRVETVPWIVQRINTIQQTYGLDKPIWIVETNAAPTLDPEWPVDRPEFPVDLEQQAWFLVQAYALGFAAGADSIGVYKFSDVLVAPGAESFGLLRADLSERPAFTAYQNLIAQFNGFTRVWTRENEAYWLVGFERPDALVQVLWAREPASVTVEVPLERDTAYLVDAFGVETALPAGEETVRLTLAGARCYDACIIGGPPIFLVQPRFGAATAAEADPETDADPAGAAPTALPASTLVAQQTTTPFPTPTSTPAEATPPPSNPLPAAAQTGLYFLAAAAAISTLLALATWRILRK